MNRSILIESFNAPELMFDKVSGHDLAEDF